MDSFALLSGRSFVVLAMAGCLSSQISLAAQDKPAPSPPPAKAPAAAAIKQPDFSKEGLVLEKVSTRIRMEADGTGTHQTTARTRILADSGVKQFAVLTFTYTALNQQVDIDYVRVIKPDGTVVVTPSYNVQDMPADVTRAAPMYSDIHEKHVAVKGLGVGDVLESQITVRTLKPEVPGQFWLEYSFDKDLIVLDEQLDLDLPADKAVTVASADLQPAITTANGRKLYHWASSNLARPDPDAPPKSVKLWKPSVQVTTFASWAQVGSWYQSLQHEPLTITPAIQAKAAALTKGLATNEEKVRAIFNEVALHTHYIGLEFGIGRYQPHPADDVLSNEYGDCKDKHTLLASLLKAAGIEAWPVLISSKRYVDPALPSPAQFDHVITVVPLEGKLLWMDSTAEVAPVGVLMDPLRDKQALAVPPNKPAYLERTPADLPTPRLVRIEVKGKLSAQGLFAGDIDETTDGDIGVLFRSAFRGVPQSQWKQLLQGIAGAQGYGGEVSNPQVSEVEQIGQPLHFSFDYSREKYYQWNDHDTTHWISPPVPAMGGELAPGVKEKKPADDPDLGATGKTTYHATMQLPTGWTMDPPKDVDLSEDWLEYHAKYSFKDGTFTAERSTQVKKTRVPLDQWDKYLALRRAMFDDWNHQTLISPVDPSLVQSWQKQIDEMSPAKKAKMGENLAAMQPLREAMAILAAESQPSADDLAKSADLANKALENIEARTLQLSADDADSLSWTQVLAQAWCVQGWAELEAKHLPAAENYLRAAWQLSQDQMIGYQYGRLLEAKGDKAAAAHVYELASVTSAGVSNMSNTLLYPSYSAPSRIAASYKKMTGKELTATSLNHGQYTGSLRAELDKQVEIHSFTPTSKVTGEALFAVVYEVGKPPQAHFLGGEKKLAPLASTLEGHRFAVSLPAGSKARLLREVRLVCSSYAGGCDAYLLLPSSVARPARKITPEIVPRNAPQGTKTVQIQLQQ
jgi:hypothetical protein